LNGQHPFYVSFPLPVQVLGRIENESRTVPSGCVTQRGSTRERMPSAGENSMRSAEKKRFNVSTQEKL
jgi:hypothetical protein